MIVIMSLPRDPNILGSNVCPMVHSARNSDRSPIRRIAIWAKHQSVDPQLPSGFGMAQFDPAWRAMRFTFLDSPVRDLSLDELGCKCLQSLRRDLLHRAHRPAGRSGRTTVSMTWAWTLLPLDPGHQRFGGGFNLRPLFGESGVGDQGGSYSQMIGPANEATPVRCCTIYSPTSPRSLSRDEINRQSLTCENRKTPSGDVLCSAAAMTQRPGAGDYEGKGEHTLDFRFQDGLSSSRSG
jgi:hypothetical protein